MLVTRGRHVGRLVVHISPERDHSAIGALVLAVDPSERIELDVEHVGEALGLTRAESRVAVAITQGKRIEDIAAETGRARATVKWHMRARWSSIISVLTAGSSTRRTIGAATSYSAKRLPSCLRARPSMPGEPISMASRPPILAIGHGQEATCR